MATTDNRRVVERLWELFDARDWDAAGELLHDEVVVEWPQSGERIRGRANVLAVNRNYPGEWAIAVRRVVVEGDAAASEVSIAIDGRREVAVSFYELRDGKIVHETDWWPEPFAAAEWRARWVERIATSDLIAPAAEGRAG